MSLKIIKNEMNLEENKAIFFQSLFSLSEAENSAIANEVIRLCYLVPPQYLDFFNGREVLINEAHKHQRNESITLKSTYQSLQEKRLLLLKYIAAFISAEIERTSDYVNKFDQYKALSLLSIMHLSCRGDHEHSPLCNELRQCTLGERDELIKYLPNINTLDLASLIDSLGKLQHIENLNNTSIPDQIRKIKSSLFYVFSNRKKITHNVKPGEFKKEGKLKFVQKQRWGDDNDTELIEIKELNFGTTEKDSPYWGEEEERSSLSRTLTIVSSAKNISKSYGAQAIEARAINENIRKKSMSLTCDIQHVTPYELHLLVSSCVKFLMDKSSFQKESQVLLLMLLTGNSFSELTNGKAYRNNSGKIVGIKRSLKLPSQQALKELQPLLSKITINYPLLLPSNLLFRLTSFTFKTMTEENLKKCISSLNKHYDINLTLTKVSSYLIQVLKGNGIDCTVIDLITGYEINNQPARFYTRIPYATLDSIFIKYLTHIGLAGETDYLDVREHIDDEFEQLFLGSPLFVETPILQALFSQLKTLINNIPTEHSDYFSENSHNLRLLYLQLMLGLVSGYRPVNGWFGYINDIHFATGEYRIAEKERVVGYSGRVIIIPKTVLFHVQQYIDYCEQATIYFSHTHPVLSVRYKQSIQADMPFCFYRHQEEIQEVSPSTYMLHINQIFPLPENWTRHYLRTLLFNHQVSDEIIGAWLGHMHSNQLPFAQFSQMSRHNLFEVRDILEKHLTLLLSGGANE